MPATNGSRATARRPAALATALFTPDATPAWRTLAADRTADVSGATVADRPRPKTTTAGSTSAAYEDPGPIRSISRAPTAETIGPSDIQARGPVRSAHAPVRDERTSISNVIGSRDNPACNGVNPATT